MLFSSHYSYNDLLSLSSKLDIAPTSTPAALIRCSVGQTSGNTSQLWAPLKCEYNWSPILLIAAAPMKKFPRLEYILATREQTESYLP